MIKVQNKYSIGQMVYLVSDPDQLERQVIYIVVSSAGLMYGVRVGVEDPLECYDIELSETKNYQIGG